MINFFAQDPPPVAADSALGSWVLIILLAVLYCLPLVVAAIRGVPNFGSVAVINVLLGWTFIGWVVALAMACRSQVAPVQVNVNNAHLPPTAPRGV